MSEIEVYLRREANILSSVWLSYNFGKINTGEALTLTMNSYEAVQDEGFYEIKVRVESV